MKNLIALLFLILVSLSSNLYAQTLVSGIVYDRESKQRLGEVQIKNLSTNVLLFNDSRGEFSLKAQAGDRISIRKLGYVGDTLTFNNQQALIINLTPAVKRIDPVQVYGRRSPDDVLKEIKRDYKKAFDLAQPKDYFTVGPTGAGVSIDALYSLVSREAKNARRFTQHIERIHEENIVDFYFSPDLVRSLTGLEDEQLQVYMRLFRPSYEFISKANHYQLVQYIKSKYEVFKLHPNLRPLRELPDIKLDVNQKK